MQVNNLNRWKTNSSKKKNG